MKASLFSRRELRWGLLVLILCSWMCVGALSNCDPTIAGQVLDGVGSATANLASTLVQALFDSIKPTVPTPVTT